MVFLLLGGPDQYLDEPPPGEEEKAFVLNHSRCLCFSVAPSHPTLYTLSPDLHTQPPSPTPDISQTSDPPNRVLVGRWCFFYWVGPTNTSTNRP